MMSLPSPTAYQTPENSRGTLDPLGLYSIADRLATRLAPDLRGRMKLPRYLTATVVVLHTDKYAQRIPLPETLAKQLSFDLEVERTQINLSEFL